ncbi:MAG: NAD kinase [Bacteroidota bacterium]
MNIVIYGKQFDLTYQTIFQEFIQKLIQSKVQVSFFKPFYEELRQKGVFVRTFPVFSTHMEIRDHANVLISIGGDGTLLNSITLVRDADIPILGLNFGRLGFLSSISRENIIAATEDLLTQRYDIEERTLIRASTKSNVFGDLNFALNDLTIHKHSSHTLIVVDVYVNNQLLNSYWADGLIVSTPTGSTGYSLSCNGPIITPDAENFVITPIATHNLTVRPIVLPDSSIITVKLRGREASYTAALDSRVAEVSVDEVFTVQKEAFTIKLIKMQEENFFNTLRSKLNWGLDNRN